jgi:hypothetical protein
VLKRGFTPIVGDYANGRDNGLGGLITLVKAALPNFGTEAYNANIQTGKVSLLIQVRDYNGEPNDFDVKTVLYSPAAFDVLDEVKGRRPAFDGKDVWPIASDSYVGENSAEPRHVSARSYVTNGVLVAAITELDLRLRIGVSLIDVADIQVKFISPYLTAKIGKDERGLWQLTEGNIAARWKSNDVLAELSRFPNPINYPDPNAVQPYFCTNNGFYTQVRDHICRATDIFSDLPAPGTQCDSLSVGIGFTSIEANLGQMVRLPERPNPCGDYDPRNDSCEDWAAERPPPAPADGGAGGDAGSGEGGS